MTQEKTRRPPLADLRVIDFARGLAGQLCATLLGDLGAEVIAVESPEGGFGRHIPGPNHKGESYYFLAWNRNKKSIALDLTTKLGGKAIRRLVEKADVVVEAFRPGVMERLGLGYAALKECNPRIVYTSITGYGPTGPYANRQSYDVIAKAEGGLLSVTGEPGGPPVNPGAAVSDFITGLFAALGTVAAMREASRTGTAQRVEVSLLDATVALMSAHLCYFFLSGEVPGPIGRGHIGAAPHSAYKTKDGYIATGGSWPRLARVVGADFLVDDLRFDTSAKRLERRYELDKILEEYFSKATAEQWLALFEVEDIGGGRVNNMAQVASHPQVLHNNMIMALEHPLGGEIRIVGSPIKLESETGRLPSSVLGQHTEEILMDVAGFSKEEMFELKKEEEEHARELHKRLHKFL